jgi:hypothetical protein
MFIEPFTLLELVPLRGTQPRSGAVSGHAPINNAIEKIFPQNIL